MTGRTRGRWVVLLLLLAGVVGLTSLPTWVRATATAPVTGDVEVTVSGSQAAPGVVAAALVLLAAAGAAGLVGRIGRWVVVLVVAGAGALVVASALAGRSGARAAAERLAADRTGVAQVAGEPEVAVWPLVVAVLGVVVVIAAGALARASARWAPPSSRHERAGVTSGPGAPSTGTAATGSTAAAESHRADLSTTAPGRTGRSAAEPGPTSPVPDGSPSAAPTPDGSTPLVARPAPGDERATWDALSRGDDPT